MYCVLCLNIPALCIIQKLFLSFLVGAFEEKCPTLTVRSFFIRTKSTFCLFVQLEQRMSKTYWKRRQNLVQNKTDVHNLEEIIGNHLLVLLTSTSLALTAIFKLCLGLSVITNGISFRSDCFDPDSFGASGCRCYNWKNGNKWDQTLCLRDFDLLVREYSLLFLCPDPFVLLFFENFVLVSFSRVMKFLSV